MTRTSKPLYFGSLLLLAAGSLSAQLSSGPAAVTFVGVPIDAPTTSRPAMFVRTPPVLAPSGTQFPVAALADFTGDGILDIVTGGFGFLYVYPGNGNGTFKPAVVTTLNGYAPVAIASGDFNHDGKRDLVLATNIGCCGGPVLLQIGRASCRERV